MRRADKNQNRLEEADLRFKEIQNAYEVLSDRHERAWYGIPPLLPNHPAVFVPSASAC